MAEAPQSCLPVCIVIPAGTAGNERLRVDGVCIGFGSRYSVSDMALV